MKGDHRHPASRTKGFQTVGQTVLQFAQLIVDRDSQSLKGTRGRIGLSRFFENDFIYDFRELPGCFYRLLLPRFNDSGCNLARFALFAELINQVGQLFFAVCIDDICRRQAGTGHPHVQSGVFAVRKAALGLINLHRRNADVKDDAVNFFGNQRVNGAETAGTEAEPCAVIPF